MLHLQCIAEWHSCPGLAKWHHYNEQRVASLNRERKVQNVNQWLMWPLQPRIISVGGTAQRYMTWRGHQTVGTLSQPQWIMPAMCGILTLVESLRCGSTIKDMFKASPGIQPISLSQPWVVTGEIWLMTSNLWFGISNGMVHLDKRRLCMVWYDPLTKKPLLDFMSIQSVLVIRYWYGNSPALDHE